MKFALALLLVLLNSVYSTETSEGEDKYLYDEATFEKLVPTKPHFVTFFSPLCGQCTRMKADWNKLTEYFNEKETGSITIAKVDCTKQRNLCKDVTGYPTINLFLPGKDPINYNEDRDFESMREFVTETLKESGDLVDKKEEEKPVAKDPFALRPVEEIVTDGLYNLSGLEYYREVSKSNVFIMFHMTYTSYSKEMMETWKEVAKFYESDEDVKIAEVDCRISKSCASHAILGYPTVEFFRDGVPIDMRSVGRDVEDLKAYVNRKLNESPAPKKTESKVVELTNETFNDIISTGITFVKFYIPSCGFCIRMAPAWKELADIDFSDAGAPVTIAQMDCIQYGTACKENGSGAYPTLLLFMNGEIVAYYAPMSPRTAGFMRLFILGMANGYRAKDHRRDEL